jgi:chaperonin GroES
MKLRPLHDRVLVQRSEESGAGKIGKIFIPDSAKEKPQQGKVVAVGNGVRDAKGERLALTVKPGDAILFGKYSGADIKVDGQEYMILREDEILAILGK